MNPLKELAESYKLPLGHYGRKDARERVDRIYARCEQQEERFLKKVPKRFLRIGLSEACSMVSRVCFALAYRPPKRLVFGSNCQPMASAEYRMRNKELHFASLRKASIATVMHELAHYVCHQDGLMLGHGDDFCETEAILLDACIEILRTSRRPKNGNFPCLEGNPMYDQY